MTPLERLVDESIGAPVPLPPDLLSFHGPLRLARPAGRPLVFANFVASVDGVVAVGRGTGADLSGGSPQDRALMGMLRAVADAVVIGAGNLRAEPDHVWTAERICPELAAAYAQLRAGMGKTAPPLQVVVTGSGELEARLPVLSGAVPALVVTTAAGADRLRRRQATVPIAVPEAPPGPIPLAAVLDAARLGASTLVLIESGPTSATQYLAEGAVDELFLTLAPILVGRSSAPGTLALVEGRSFVPWSLRGSLLSLRRGGDFLFLRYALQGPGL